MRLMHASWFFSQSKSGWHGYNIIRWTRPPFSPVFIKNKRTRPPFSPVFIKNKRTRPPFSSVFAKNKRNRPPFSSVFIKNKRNHPPFSSVFKKNRRSKGLEQLFSRKTNVPRGWNNHFWEKQTFQGVGTIIFEKNKCSKGLEQPFSRKTNVPRGWNNHFWEKQTFQGVGTAIFEKNNALPTDEAYIHPFFKVSYTPPRIFLLPLLPQIQIQIRYYGDWFR